MWKSNSKSETSDKKSLPQKKIDMVNHPSHYTFSKYEVIDVLGEWFPHDPLLWQIVKYIARCRHKNNYLEDLKKARFYLERAIADAENSVEK